MADYLRKYYDIDPYEMPAEEGLLPFRFTQYAKNPAMMAASGIASRSPIARSPFPSGVIQQPQEEMPVNEPYSVGDATFKHGLPTISYEVPESIVSGAKNPFVAAREWLASNKELSKEELDKLGPMTTLEGYDIAKLIGEDRYNKLIPGSYKYVVGNTVKMPKEGEDRLWWNLAHMPSTIDPHLQQSKYVERLASTGQITTPPQLDRDPYQGGADTGVTSDSGIYNMFLPPEGEHIDPNNVNWSSIITGAIKPKDKDFDIGATIAKTLPLAGLAAMTAYGLGPTIGASMGMSGGVAGALGLAGGAATAVNVGAGLAAGIGTNLAVQQTGVADHPLGQLVGPLLGGALAGGIGGAGMSEQGLVNEANKHLATFEQLGLSIEEATGGQFVTPEQYIQGHIEAVKAGAGSEIPSFTSGAGGGVETTWGPMQTPSGVTPGNLGSKMLPKVTIDTMERMATPMQEMGPSPFDVYYQERMSDYVTSRPTGESSSQQANTVGLQSQFRNELLSNPYYQRSRTASVQSKFV